MGAIGTVDSFAIVILVGSFFILMFLRVQIAFAMAFSTIITTLYLGLPLMLVFQNMVAGLKTFTFMAVPFFIIAGEVMSEGGISEKIVKFANSIVGWMRGGLAQVNVVDSMFFGGISGSAAADTASLGTILIPMMRKQGYDDEFSTSLTITTSIQGMLIPPSHNMILYAIAAGGVSVSKLFLAGFAPGISLGIALMIYVYFISKKRKYPFGDKFSIKNFLKTSADAFWGLFTIIIIIVGVTGGVFTATESAAIAAVYAIIVSAFVYKKLSFKSLYKVMGKAIKTLTVIMVLVAVANAFGWLIAYLRIPYLLTSSILSFTTNKIIILLIINLLLLILGMVMSMSSIIIILTPILVPLVMQVGVDPVHFGIIMILNLGIGVLTPPVGAVLFIGSAVSGVKIERLIKAMLPFYLVMVIVLIIITYIPQITLFLPNLIAK